MIPPGSQPRDYADESQDAYTGPPLRFTRRRLRMFWVLAFAAVALAGFVAGVTVKLWMMGW